MWDRKLQMPWPRKPVTIGRPTLVNKTLDENLYPSLSKGNPLTNDNTSIANNNNNNNYTKATVLPARVRDPSDSPSIRRPSHADLQTPSFDYYSKLDANQPRQNRDALTQSSSDTPSRGYLNPGYPSSFGNPNISPPDTPSSSSSAHHQSPVEVSPISEEFPESPENEVEQPKSNSCVPVTPEKVNNIPITSDHPQSYHNSYIPSSQKNSVKMSVPAATSSFDNAAAPAASTWQELAPKSGGFFKHFSSRKKPPVGVTDPVQETKPSLRIRASKSNDRLRTETGTGRTPIVPSVVTTITGGKDTNVLTNSRSSRKNYRQLPTQSTPTSLLPPRVDLPKLDHVDDDFSELKVDDRPVSRFSETTYASSEVGSFPNSARGSAAASTENLSPAMVRDRLIPKARALESSAKATSRKPTPMQVAKQRENIDSPSQQSPADQTENRIKELEARRDSLWSRKNSIAAVIKELTQVIQPSSVAYDLAVRDEVRKTVASLNDELAEVQKEEHEVGLKLVRIWRKRDERQLNGGGSSLWVRRITT